MNTTNFIPIIGMEIHVEPTTNSKMFCNCSADHFGKTPNSQTCPVCLGLPGALPVPNQKAIEACLKLGLALNCKINLTSKFDRKNYFYPDLPKAYQISQYDIPFCHNGNFQLKTENQKLKTINITRVHMEEDTGKLQHTNGTSLIDFNRSGVPLIEIVTEPDLHSAEEMKIFLKKLVHLIKWLEISNCNMEKGELRLEANISVLKTFQKNSQTLKLPNYKVEIKNVNSFNFLEKAVKYEIERQTEILKTGKIPKQETRGFNEKNNQTFSQRSKENSQDYRYFPEPDIPPIQLTKAHINKIKNSLPELPSTATNRLIKKYKIRPDYVQFITQNKKILTAFETLILKLPQNITPSEIAKHIINQKLNIQKLSPKQIIIQIKSSQKQYSLSESEIEKIIIQTLKQNPKPITDYKAGKQNAIGFLIGQIAKQTKGQANPQIIRQLLIKKLNN